MLQLMLIVNIVVREMDVVSKSFAFLQLFWQILLTHGEKVIPKC